MPGPHDPRQNHLLAALPEEERTRIFPHLELVPMPLGEAVCKSGLQMWLPGGQEGARSSAAGNLRSVATRLDRVPHDETTRCRPPPGLMPRSVGGSVAICP
jgi:hypothetical protein